MAQQTFSGVPAAFSAGEILTASDQEKLRDFILYLIKDGDETDTGEVSPLILDLGNDRVGINTDAPAQALEIAGATDALALADNGTTTTLFGSDSANTGLIGTTSNHDVRVITNNAERIRVNATGLGVGKTPAQALDVNGTIDSTVNPPPIVETFASQSISASGTTVTFTSGRFASAPNVMVTQATSGGGASKVPNVDSITTSSCRVFLLDTSNSFVAGDASLLATLEV